jgi:threonyl-tRNA synthetase
MIHRALLGSLERFIGILIEHYGGFLPAWLAPVQCKIVPVSEKHIEYAQALYAHLRGEAIRVEIDRRNEKVGYKIRDAETNKVPFIIVVGEKEQDARNLTYRRHGRGDQGSCSVEEFITLVRKEIDEKRVPVNQ